MQLASTMGFVLNNRNGKFLGISDDERAALHECLTWLRPGHSHTHVGGRICLCLSRYCFVSPRQPGNNRLCFYGDELEQFDKACRELMKKIKQIIPEGCPRARIRATTRVSKRLADGTISETLGDESRGMVVPSP